MQISQEKAFVVGYCAICRSDNAQFGIVRYSEIVREFRRVANSEATHQLVGACVACQVCALFQFSIVGDGSYPVQLESLKEIDGNILASSRYKVKLKGQLPRPKSPDLLEFLPANVERSLKDAETSYLAGHWNQAVAAYRKAIERGITPFVVDDPILQKQSRPMLGQKLAALERQGDLPSAMLDWIRLVKDAGNLAMHEDETDFESQREVEPTRLFARTLLEYLYTLPAIIKSVTQSSES